MRTYSSQSVWGRLGKKRNNLDLHWKDENLKCDREPSLISFNNSQVETLKSVIDCNIHLDQKIKERSLFWKKHCAVWAIFHLAHEETSYFDLIKSSMTSRIGIPKNDIPGALLFHVARCCAFRQCHSAFLHALTEAQTEFIPAKGVIFKSNCWENKGLNTGWSDMRPFPVCNHTGLLCHWALQFSTFPDE